MTAHARRVSLPISARLTAGLEYLSNLISLVDRGQIARPAATTLRGFYLSKLDDGHALLPALSALGVLAKLPSFGDEEAEEVYRA